MIVMLVMPAWALSWQLFNGNSGWLAAEQRNYLLGLIGIGNLGLQIWMMVEGLLLWRRARGVLEEGLPPLPERVSKLKTAAEGTGA